VPASTIRPMWFGENARAEPLFGVNLTTNARSFADVSTNEAMNWVGSRTTAIPHCRDESVR
jgi:hypothetical protein